jgi:L-asparaginase
MMELVRRRMAHPDDPHRDTMVMIASDGNGISGASTTAGWDYKHPGRAGDTGIIGAGLYVDSRFGGACCTHTGEMATRAGTARYVVSQMEAGKSAETAVKAAIDDLATLRGGVLGPLVIYAINHEGTPHATIVNGTEPFSYQYWREGMKKPEVREAPVARVAFRP